jgi:hypothetical protein
MSARILLWLMQNLNALQVIRVSFSYHRDIRLTPKELTDGNLLSERAHHSPFVKTSARRPGEASSCCPLVLRF